MKRLSGRSCLVVEAVILLAFKSNGYFTSKSDLVCFRAVDAGTKPSVLPRMKVFEKDACYYDVSLEEGTTFMALKGKYKILDESHYQEEVTNVQFNAQWDLKDKKFINSNELSKDKKSLVLSGVIYSRNGMDSVKWTEKYRKVEVPE